MYKLPLIDGCFIIDNSMLEKFQSCPYEWQLAYAQKRIASSNRAGLNFGSACHLALNLHYLGQDSKIPHALEKHFETSPEPVGDYRNLNMATEWWSQYQKCYPKEPFEILRLKDERLFVERSFLRAFGYVENRKFFTAPSTYTPITSEWVEMIKKANALPILYSGRIDLGVQDNGEWVIDHKSAFQFGKSFTAEMTATPQLRGYCWEFNNYYGQLPKGYIINAFRVRPPTKESQYDSSALFRIGGKDPDFQRIAVQITQDDIDEWQQNTFNLIEEVLFHAKRGTFGKHKKSCVSKYGPCQFYELCNSVAKEYRESYLASNVFQDNTWSALNVPQTETQKENP